MSDWEVVPDNEIQSAPAPTPSDWEVVSNSSTPFESQSQMTKQQKMDEIARITGMYRTPFDTLQDIGAGTMGAAQHLASALGEGGKAIGNLMEKIPGFSKLQKYVQEKTGISVPNVDIREELGLGKNNPVDLSKLLASKNPNALAVMTGKILPSVIAGGASLPGQAIAGGISGAIQADPNQRNAFGYLPSGRLGAGIQDAASIYGVGKALPLIGKLAKETVSTFTSPFARINPKQVAQSVQQSHDVLKKSASDIFSQVGNEATKRGVNVVPNVTDLVTESANYFPKTRSAQSLIEKAKTGDYESLRKLQSDLFTRGNKNRVSKLASDRDAGEEMLDIRDQINEAIADHFKNTGNHDLNDLLNAAKGKYYNLQKTYYSHPTVGRLVNEQTRKIPKNIMNVFAEDSVPMQRLRNENPLLAKKIDQMINKQNALGRLKWLGIGGGTAAGALEGYKLLNSFNKGEQ